MSKLVVHGATLKCSMGNAPAQLAVLPVSAVQGDYANAANIHDMKPSINILPFGMCISMLNPQVAAATAVALGALTPQPCLPMTNAPWTPGSISVTVGGDPAVSDSCVLMCQWGGQIQVQVAGQMTTDVD